MHILQKCEEIYILELCSWLLYLIEIKTLKKV